MFTKSERERLFRDARAGKFHPANPLLTHEIVGKIALSINPDDQRRWGRSARLHSIAKITQLTVEPFRRFPERHVANIRIRRDCRLRHERFHMRAHAW